MELEEGARGEMGMDWQRAIPGLVLVAVGVTLLVSSIRRAPCVDCEDDPEDTIADVAAASAAVVEEAEAVVSD